MKYDIGSLWYNIEAGVGLSGASLLVVGIFGGIIGTDAHVPLWALWLVSIGCILFGGALLSARIRERIL